MDETKQDLLEAARVVDEQATANPDLGIPVDPDVAAHMGAFEEPAVMEDDSEEDDWRRTVDEAPEEDEGGRIAVVEGDIEGGE